MTRRRNPLTRRQQRTVSRDIGELVREGYPDGHGQAGAVAYAKARRRGWDVSRRNPPSRPPAFGASDVGCYIDGAGGEGHAVRRMLDLLKEVVAYYRIGNMGDAARNLIAEYEEGIDDEFVGEWLDDATEVLQEATAEGLVWDWQVGDLCLVEESELEP